MSQPLEPRSSRIPLKVFNYTIEPIPDGVEKCKNGTLDAGNLNVGMSTTVQGTVKMSKISRRWCDSEGNAVDDASN